MNKCMRCGEAITYDREESEYICPKCGWEKAAAENFATKYPEGSRARRKIEISAYSLKLDAKGFLFNNRYHSYDTIAKIHFDTNDSQSESSEGLPIAWPRAQKYGSSIGIIFRISFIDGKHIMICNKRFRDYLTNGKAEVNREFLYLYSAYKRLMKESLPYRQLRYDEKIRRMNFFRLGKIEFHNDGTLEYRNKRYNSIECEFRLAETFLEIGLPNRLSPSKKKIHINIANNSDVISALLKKMYNTQL